MLIFSLVHYVLHSQVKILLMKLEIVNFLHGKKQVTKFKDADNKLIFETRKNFFEKVI